MSKSTKQLIPYWYMISYRNSYYMQNMWYIATTCIITFTKQCTHRFNMYHQAQIILYYTYWMTHYNNFQKPNDTYKILWNTTNSRISWPSKTLYTLFKMYQQAHWFKMYQQTLHVSMHRLKHYTHWFKMYQQTQLMAQLLKLITDTW